MARFIKGRIKKSSFLLRNDWIMSFRQKIQKKVSCGSSSVNYFSCGMWLAVGERHIPMGYHVLQNKRVYLHLISKNKYSGNVLVIPNICNYRPKTTSVETFSQADSGSSIDIKHLKLSTPRIDLILKSCLSSKHAVNCKLSTF